MPMRDERITELEPRGRVSGIDETLESDRELKEPELAGMFVTSGAAVPEVAVDVTMCLYSPPLMYTV